MGDGHDPVTARIRRDHLLDLLDTMTAPAQQRITAEVAVPPALEAAPPERPTSKHATRRRTTVKAEPGVLVRFTSTGSQAILAVPDSLEAAIASIPRPPALPMGTAATPPLARVTDAAWTPPTPAIVAPPYEVPNWVVVALSYLFTTLVVAALMFAA